MVREEIERWMMGGRTGRRAWIYEEKLKERRRGVMVRKLGEDRWKKEKLIGRWEQERKEFQRKKGRRGREKKDKI